jgi:hypothetical protein
MLVLDIATQLWWIRGGGIDYKVPTWLAHQWVQAGMKHKEE